MYFLEKKKDKL